MSDSPYLVRLLSPDFDAAEVVDLRKVGDVRRVTDYLVSARTMGFVSVRPRDV
jgi:hypothetical protein